MIIELFGLPGSGKTALAATMQANGAVLVPMPSRARLIFDAGLFWFSHPLTAIRILKFIIKWAPRGMQYSLL